LRTNGICVISEFADVETVSKIRNQIEYLLNHDNHEIQRNNDMRIFNAERFSAELSKFHNEKLVKRIGSFYLGFPMVPISTLANIVPLSDSELGSGGDWHRDANYPQFKALLYLSDVNLPADGAFQYIPRTNRLIFFLKGLIELRHNVFDTRWKSDQVLIFPKHPPVSVLGKAGTLVIFDTCLLHRGAPNNRPLGGSRFAITNYYKPKFTNIGI
jgi:hypothetical protein